MDKLYGLCVGVIGIDPEYFWNVIQVDELTAIQKANDGRNKDEWERTRLLCYYSVITVNGNKQFKTPEDLFKIAWDKKKKNGDKN